MTAHIKVLIAFAVMLAALAGCAPGKYIPKANEEIYGAWANDQYSGIMSWTEYAPQLTVSTPGNYADYRLLTDHDPAQAGKLEIASKWTDSEGNAWYKTLGSGSDGDKVFRFQRLEKVSRSSAIREFQFVFVERFDPQFYPKALDPNASLYRIYRRMPK